MDREVPGHAMEDRVIEMVFHYYTTTTLLNARITPFWAYKHQQGESFESFMARAERIIVSANIPTLDMNQLSILTHIDMITNRTLLEEVHKAFDEIFKISHAGAIVEIRKIHSRLMTSRTKSYNVQGEGSGQYKPPKQVNTLEGDSPVPVQKCFKCGGRHA